MTESTGTVKSYASLRTKMLIENITPQGTFSLVTLRPEWDDKMSEHQLVTRGENVQPIPLRVPNESKGFFEIGSYCLVEITKA